MGERVEIHEVELPERTLVSAAFQRIDFGDAFSAQLPERGPRDVDAFAHALLTRVPRWIDGLLRVRDAVVGLVGLKTDGARNVPARFEPGRAVGLFEVFARNDEEILFGTDDAHLDFRLSCLARDGKATLTTVVRFHGVRGRAYFAVVRPFHERIVPAMLRASLG